MSKAGFGELGSKGKLDSLGGHGVNLNIIGKPVCSCVRLVNNLPYLTSVSFLNIAYQSRFGETCPLSFNSKSAIAHYLIRFFATAQMVGDHPVVRGVECLKSTRLSHEDG